MLTDYYKGEAQFNGNCQMGTENFIQGEVSSPDGVKFKPGTNMQVMDTISHANYSKFGQLQEEDICIPLNSAFWNKNEFNNKMLYSSQTENCPFTLGPTSCIENVNENCIDNICESSKSHIVQVHIYPVSSVANPHWFIKYVKSCNTEEFDHRKINYGNMNEEVQLYKISNIKLKHHKITRIHINVLTTHSTMYSSVIFLLAKVIQFYHYKCIFMQNQESCTSLHISVINQVLDNVLAFVN